MTAAEFERLFEPSVRMLFNFDRARRERWPVTVTVLTDRDELGALILPWRHAKRAPARQLHVGEGGEPHTVASAARYLHALRYDQRFGVIEQAAAVMAGHPRATILPAARSSAGLHLLDGCHRTVATYLTGVPFEIAVAAIRVPRSTAWSIVDA